MLGLRTFSPFKLSSHCFQTLWRYILTTLEKSSTLARMLPTLPLRTTINSGDVYLTDFTVEIFSDSCRQIPTEAQLFMDLVLRAGDETTMRIFGPFIRESEWSWRLAGSSERIAKQTLAKLFVYICEVPCRGTLHLGSMDINEGRISCLRLASNQCFSDTLKRRDNLPIAKLSAHISPTSEGRGRRDESDSHFDVVDSTPPPVSAIDEMTPRHPSAASPPDPAALLDNLGDFFLTQFEHTEAVADINEAVKNLQEAASLTPDEHPNKPARLEILGRSFQTQFDCTGTLSSIEKAITNLQQAASLAPNESPDKPRTLHNLGTAFATRFWCTRTRSDIEKAVENHQQALSLTPDGHPYKPARLADLGTSLYGRFECMGVLSDLERGIKHLQEALSLAQEEGPHKSIWLVNIGRCFFARFEHAGVLSDIEEAIKNQQKALLSLASDRYHVRPSWLGELGDSFCNRFLRTGVPSDLEEAIRYQQQAVLLSPDGHHSKSKLLNNLSVSLLTRFQTRGEPNDFEEGIKNLQQAISQTPDGHPNKPGRLENLGSCLQIRFELKGVLSDLEKAIKNQQQAVLLIPDGDLEKPSSLHKLGISFNNRFERTGVDGDLEEGIRNLQQAVLLTPDGHPDKPARLANLGSSLRTRFVQTGVLSDLDQAVKIQQQAISLTPDGHPGKSMMLQALGCSLQKRFEQTLALDNLEEAIKIQEQALSLVPDGALHKPGILHNLGASFHSRFRRTKILSDIDEAIKYKQQVVLLIPDGHPGKTKALDSLAVSFGSRYAHTQAPNDLDLTMSHFWSAGNSNGGPPAFRFRSLIHWASLKSIFDLPSALAAYRRAMDLIPQIAWIGDPVSVRHFHLTVVGDLLSQAAVFALDVDQPDLALEWLEQGRSVVWNQLLDLRASDESLRETHPDIYDRFTFIARQLQSAAIREQKRERSLGIDVSFEDETQQHHRLAEEWDSLVDHIQSLPGFEDFLSSKKVSSLSKAAESGPVVVINVHPQRCDALVLLKGKKSVHHIPLKELSYAEVEEMLKWLKQDLADGLCVRGEDRARKPFKAPGLRIPKILSILFSKVMRPILQDLNMMVRGSDASKLPRIWWCPTGPLSFLPLHAAGIETPGGRDEVSDYVVSSYIPTVNALLEARAAKRQPLSRIAGIAMSNNPPHHRLNPLPHALIELEKIRQLFQKDSNRTFSTLRNEQATKGRVLEDMANSSWVHLACHAEQDAKEPTQSGLWLHDGRLTITDLISQRFQHADLAFLSACQTATGDEKTSDEAVHITAAMLGAGYRSIIGTMWSIPDAVAPILAAKVYEVLLSEGEPDSEMAARALHEGVKELQKSGERSFYSWVAFVHYGL